jgi:hypothetical protein
MPDTITLPDLKALAARLARPFDPAEVKWKAQAVKGNRALAVAYVDARVIQDRLDEALGPAGWQDEYDVLPDGAVVCRLRLRLGAEWLTKVDVGSPSEQPDEGDRRKAAFSDALKRAAVKWGLGRYLYRLPHQWVDYDPQKKQLTGPPALPEWARPAPEQEVRGTPQEAKGTPPQAPTAKRTVPTTGEELQKRLYAYDARLAAEGVCRPGELVKRVVDAAVKAGLPPVIGQWQGDTIRRAVQAAQKAEADLRARHGKPTPTTREGGATGAQVAEVRKLAGALGWREPDLAQHLGPYEAEGPADLTEKEAAEVIDYLRDRIDEQAAHQGEHRHTGKGVDV